MKNEVKKRVVDTLDILLIYPKPRIAIDQAKCLPLGLAYIAAVLEKEGHHVSVLDLNVQSDNLEIEIRSADVVGIYAYTAIVKAAWQLCDIAKRSNPNVVTVLGGPHVSALPLESLQRGSVDIVIRGDGEYAMAELCGRLEKRQKLEDVKGISYKESLRLKENPDRKRIKNLDELPFPARHLFPLDHYTPSRPTWVSKKAKPVTIITSRGCPYNCVFCYSARSEYRYRSPQNVLDEVRFLVDEYKVNYIEILDDLFTLIPKRAVEFCNLLIKEGVDVEWLNPEGNRVDLINRDFLVLAKRSGCRDVWYAVESGSQRVLDEVMSKGITIEQVRKAVKMSKEIGLKVGGFIVIGSPGETQNEIVATVDFACSLGLDYGQITICTPYPGTQLYNWIKREGKLLIDDWDMYNPFLGRAFYEYGETKKEMVERMFRWAYRRFYLNPSFLAKLSVNPAAYRNLFTIMKDSRIRYFLR